jgi:hypothetical protein
VRKVDLAPPQALGIPYACASDLPAQCTSSVCADDPRLNQALGSQPAPGPQADSAVPAYALGGLGWLWLANRSDTRPSCGQHSIRAALGATFLAIRFA